MLRFTKRPNGNYRALSIICPPSGVRLDPVMNFESLLAMQPELVIFGSGERLRFAAPALMASLFERRIGVETMDTAAACRTFNVLAGERRRVVAALLVETPVNPSE